MKKLLSILALLFLLISCSKDDTQENLLARYAGTWSGTYTGVDDNGTWSIVVTEEGVATGVASSLVFSQTFPINGVIAASGSAELTTGTTTPGGTFTGSLNSSTGEASGSWVNHLTSPPMTGTWEGNKN